MLDALLISASVFDLQKMLDACFSSGITFRYCFLFFLRWAMPMRNDHLCNLRMGKNNIKWTDRLKYLGIQLLSNKFFRIDISGVLRKVYCADNSSLENTKYVSDIVKLNLFDVVCLQFLRMLLIQWT